MQDWEKEKYLKEEFVRVKIHRGWLPIRKLHKICVTHEAVILGGYVRWMCSTRNNPAPPKDVDIYCPDEDVFKSMREAFAAEELVIKNENDIAIAYNKPEHPHWLFCCPQIQLIKPIREGVIVTNGSMEEILKNFDFTVVRIGIDSHISNGALADPDFIEDEKAMRLRIKNIHCPISSMYRVMKYKEKGYFPSTGLILKLFLDWEERPMETKEKIIAFYKKLEEDDKSVSKEDIEEMERLMRLID